MSIEKPRPGERIGRVIRSMAKRVLRPRGAGEKYTDEFGGVFDDDSGAMERYEAASRLAQELDAPWLDPRNKHTPEVFADKLSARRQAFQDKLDELRREREWHTIERDGLTETRPTTPEERAKFRDSRYYTHTNGLFGDSERQRRVETRGDDIDRLNREIDEIKKAAEKQGIYLD